MKNIDNKKIVSEIFYAALKAVDPYASVETHTGRIFSTYQKGNYKKLFVTGFGKAACPMSKAIEDHIKDLIDTGIVITKYKHCSIPFIPDKIEVHEAGHPVPDINGLKGAENIIKLLQNSDEKTLLICLISGGGSALLVCPFEGVSLVDKQRITESLLKAGANIQELNTVRKHISRVKGGRIAELAHPSKVISLIISDVIGDRLDIIASGPTAPDPTTYNDALRILEQYDLIDTSPSSVIEVLKKGKNGLIPETPKERSPIFERVDNIIIGSNKNALKAAKTKAEKLGFYAEVLSSEISGEAIGAGKLLAQKAKETKNSKSINRPICLISGGETTVTVKGNGLGGRNMELALSLAMDIEGVGGVTFLSAGTDGTDGPTDAAGAIVDGHTILKAKSIGLDPDEYLRNNDSYNFFKILDGLFITGPTGTNVMDIQIMVIE